MSRARGRRRSKRLASVSPRSLGVPASIRASDVGLSRWLIGIARICCTATSTSSFVYGALAKMWRPRLGLIFTEHGRLSDAPASLKRRLVNPWLARIPNRLFAVSEDLRRELIGQGFPANRLGVIFNGIDPGVLTTDEDRRRARLLMGISDSTLVVGSVARLDPVKDLTTLIAGFAELHRRRADSVLLIVGDGPERGALAGAAAAQGLDRHVHFTGYRSDARALLPAMNIYASTSISEGISLTLLEAMAAGLPIVATRVGGTPEVVIDGETGLLVPARNVPALSSGLMTLAESADTRREMGSRARLRVERHFSLDRMLAEYHRTYRQLARC